MHAPRGYLLRNEPQELHAFRGDFRLSVLGHRQDPFLREPKQQMRVRPGPNPDHATGLLRLAMHRRNARPAAAELPLQSRGL